MIPDIETFVMMFVGTENPYFRSGRGPKPGMYLRRYDPEFAGGMGIAGWTENAAEAMTFSSREEAYKTWNTVPKAKPVREDGLPNKPLTVHTVSIENHRHSSSCRHPGGRERKNQAAGTPDTEMIAETSVND